MTDEHKLTDKVETGVKPAGPLHPAVARVLDQNATTETLREVLALQREWEAGEAKKAFTAALIRLKRDLPNWIPRDTKVAFDSARGRVSYSHASLAGIMSIVIPKLTEHGFSLSWKPTSDNRLVKVTAELTHEQGHTKETTLEAPPDNSGSKSPAQAVASTITLLERYSSMALLGLASADMVDEDGPREPAGQAEGEVDANRNMRALREIINRGHTKEEAEKETGKSIKEWTPADLDVLRAWLAKAEAAKAPAAAPAKGKPEKAEVITKEDYSRLQNLMREFDLKPTAMATVIETETGHKPASLIKLPQADFLKIEEAFGKARIGEVDFKRDGLCFVRPDDVELDAEAAQEEIPF